ncbi:hypothetical protein GE061_002715 [Apolygus lucorum]|uniref:Uncharacterized protein n=1 Tax=Apolygus lucorum TaxID=248454 RepID=A0A6A4JAC7_APOLU|nr:hypothetical protein GE061_002715 [Apolygus lucorum]
MRLLWLALVGTAGVAALAAPEPGKIIVDDKAKNPDDKKWKPLEAAPTRLFREERVHGEVLVLSPPLFVRGPPKGFPFKRKREASPFRSSSGRRNRIPELSRQPERVHGEVVVHSSPLNIKGPPKGYPLRRTARDVASYDRDVLSADRDVASAEGDHDFTARAASSNKKSKPTKKPSNKESLKRQVMELKDAKENTSNVILNLKKD